MHGEDHPLTADSMVVRAEVLAAVGRTEASRTLARQALAAYEGHLGEVRSAVSDLQSRLGALDELVQRDPIAPANP